jgi:hypothetical protein
VKPNYLEILEDARQRIQNILKDEYDLITTWYDASSHELEIRILRGFLGYEGTEFPNSKYFSQFSIKPFKFT